jgi:hypothetical protein
VRWRHRGGHDDSHSGAPAFVLVAVVGLAKVESPAIEAGVAAIGFPQSFVGVVIALLVLLPETLAATRAAGTACRRASILPSAPPWPASA